MTIPQAAADAFRFYRSQPDPIGRTPAAGIVAVLYAESALKPGSQGSQSTETGGVLNPGGAYGIASWNGPRQQSLKDFATTKVWPVDDVRTQLMFVLTECANSYPAAWAAIQNPTTIEDFVSKFVAVYETPKDIPGEVARALLMARELLTLADPTPAPIPVPVPVPPAPIPVPTPVPVPVPLPPPPPPIPALDPEIMAVGEALAALSPLSSRARARALAFLTARLTED